MKNIKLLSIPVLMLGIMASSCSKDDDKTPTTPSGAAIKFTVVAPKAPRDASRPETTTATIDYFLLNAFTKGEPYIDNLGVEKESNNWVPAQTIYWPASTVNFYAVSPDIRTGATGRIGNNLMMSYTNEGATDLLYSVAMDQKQTDALNPKPVSLNFRHALSRVVVMMSSNNSLIKVNVSKVTLANIYKTGVFEFPKETTTEIGGGFGKWSAQETSVSPTIFSGNIILKPEAQEFSTENYSFTMPQALDPVVKEGTGFSGSFIEVECTITDEKDVALWPNSVTPAENVAADGQHGIIRFPLSQTDSPTNWEAGIAYIYNILINEVPGLSGIDFDVTVDKIDYNNNIPLEQ